MQRELVEVHQNARSAAKCEVKLTPAQVQRGLAKPKRKAARKASVPKGYELVPVKPPKKKQRKKSGGARKGDEMMMVMGAAFAGAVEVMVFRNLEWADKIPWQLRRYSGVAMAFLGWGLNQMKGVKGNMRAFYTGFMAGGAYLAVSDELVKARKEQVVSEAKKYVEEALKAVSGLGSLIHSMPGPPHLTAGQAMSNLGQQTRVPYHPHGMGELVWGADAGLGSIVAMPASITTDPSVGLGELVETSGGWADGQIAFSDDQDDIWGRY